jgi:hypothetical protein
MLMQPDPTKATPLTPAAKAALEKLADITVPAPAPWTPQTWGWAVLALALLALVVWLAIRAVRLRRANRYRVEALAELTTLESQISDGGQRAAAVAAMPRLLKRVALAAWPRTEVASLSGESWVAFLRAHAGRHGVAEDAARVLADGEYRPESFADMSAADAGRVVSDVRHRIEDHHVSP